MRLRVGLGSDKKKKLFQPDRFKMAALVGIVTAPRSDRCAPSGVHMSADAVQVKAEREFAAADRSASVRLLSVSQNPLWRACDLQ